MTKGALCEWKTKVQIIQTKPRTTRLVGKRKAEMPSGLCMVTGVQVTEDAGGMEQPAVDGVLDEGEEQCAGDRGYEG